MLKRNLTLKVVMLKLLSMDFSWAAVCSHLTEIRSLRAWLRGTRAASGWQVCTQEEVFLAFPSCPDESSRAGCWLLSLPLLPPRLDS